MALPLELRAGLALAAVAVGLWGWHRLAEGYREEGRNECRVAAAAEMKENTDALSRIADKARAEQFKSQAAAADARAAAERLRGAVAGSGLVVRAAAAGGSASASDAGVVPPDVLDVATQLAELADQRSDAGSTCERSYDALRQ